MINISFEKPGVLVLGGANWEGPIAVGFSLDNHATLEIFKGPPLAQTTQVGWNFFSLSRARGS